MPPWAAIECARRAESWKQKQETLYPSSASDAAADAPASPEPTDRKSTRLNSSHSQISYAVFCLKKKKKTQREHGAFQSGCKGADDTTVSNAAVAHRACATEAPPMRRSQERSSEPQARSTLTRAP